MSASSFASSFVGSFVSSLVGAPAPRFELPMHGGGTWALDDALRTARERAVVIVFHRHIH